VCCNHFWWCFTRVAAWKRLLEENDDYRRWYDNLVRGSLNTGNLYARTLYRICGTLELSPAQLVKTAREDVRGFEDTVFDYVTKQEHDGKRAGWSIMDSSLSVRSRWGTQIIRLPWRMSGYQPRMS